ncbi:MAG: hypothetical protein ABR601_11020 [Parasphingopyxis sp.]|nr:hypothetical protein [Sphingomonadales bacterium]
MAKAASTYLQREFFSRLDGLAYLGKNSGDDALAAAGHRITRASSLVWSEEDARSAFQAAIEQAEADNTRPIFSDEDLSVFKFLDPKMSCDRLRAVLGPYDILFVVRHPISWLRSQYLFRLTRLIPSTLFGYDEWFGQSRLRPHVGSDTAEMNFAALIDVYSQSCGGTVNIVPFELFKLDREALADILAGVTGCDPSAVRRQLEIPRDKQQHKRSITATEVELYQTAKWLILQRPTEFREAIETVCRDNQLTIPDEVREKAEGLLSRKEFRPEKWRPFYTRLRRAQDGKFEDGAPAEIDLNDRNRQLVANKLEQQLRKLGYAPGDSLFGTDVVYSADGACLNRAVADAPQGR